MNTTTIAPRRRIEQRHPVTGELIGTFETTLSDAEMREQDRQTAERRDKLLAEGLAVTVAERQRQQTERDALAGVGVDGGARDRLRAAHRIRAQAQDELARRREVMAAAEGHVARCQAAYDRAREAVAAFEARAARTIVAQLERGETPTPPTPTRTAGERAATAEADLEHAKQAQAEVAALLEEAARAAEAAEAEVREAARGVIRLRVSELEAETAALNRQAAALRGRVAVLLPTLTERRWEVPWPAAAAALLVDPEAELDAAEAV